MDKNELYNLSDDALLEQKKKMLTSKRWYALSFGFLAGVVIFGLANWLLFSEKRYGFLLPVIIPVFLMYKMVKTPNKYKDLEEVLKERNLK